MLCGEAGGAKKIKLSGGRYVDVLHEGCVASYLKSRARPPINDDDDAPM